MSEQPITFKADIKIHNRFKIEVRDKDTGVLKQKGIAENIILDRAYTRVCNFSSYFSYIHFGTGTGELSPSRVSLFAPLGYKSAVLDSSENAYPVSKVTKSITLDPEEHVGKEITEVGISETTSTSAMNTHALIKDAEGNPLSINKTALDVVVIYATVFINFENPSDDFIFTSFPRNQIATYFIKHTNISNVIKAEKGIELGFSTTRETGSNTGTRVVNTSARKTTVNTRFATTQANGEIKSVGLFESLKVRFPAAGVYTGVNLEGIKLGVGDGINKVFGIPNLSPTALVVKNNNAIVINYAQNRHIIVEQHKQNLAGIGSNGYGATISPDGKIVITASSNAPQFTVQTLNEATGDYEHKQDLAGIGSHGRGAAIVADGKTVITVSSGAPYFTVQTLNEATGDYEHKQNLTGVGSDGRGAAISADGKTVITVSGSSSAPQFTVQTLNEATGDYEHKQNLTGVGSNGQRAAISPDGKTVITVSYSAPYFTVQTLNEATGDYEHKQNLAGIGNEGRGAAISPDGKTVITASGNAPYFTVQTLNEATGDYEYKQNLTGVGDDGRRAAIAADGKTVITVSNSTPYFTVQTLNEATGDYEHKQNVAGNEGLEAAISADGKTVITASNKTPYFTVQTLSENKYFVIFDTPPASGDIITADYHVAHIPKSEDYVLDVAFELQFGEGI